MRLTNATFLVHISDVDCGKLCKSTNEDSPSSLLLLRCCNIEVVVLVGAGKGELWPSSLNADTKQGHTPHITCWGPPVCHPATQVITGLPLPLPHASDQPPQGGGHRQ